MSVRCPGVVPALLTAAVAAVCAGPAAGQTSEPDLTFIPDAGVRIEQASNPSAGVDPSGSVYLYYGNRATRRPEVSISADGLTFPAGSHPTNWANDPRSTRMPDGTWRRYLWDPRAGGLASESSRDGLTFRRDEGVRYRLHESDNGEMGIYDAFSDTSGGVVLLYLGDLHGTNNLRRAYSTDNGSTFTFERGDVLGDGSGGGGPNSFVDTKLILLPDGRRRLVCMRQMVIYSFVTADEGRTFTREAGTRLRPSDFTEFDVTGLYDPSVVRLPDGRYRMYVAATIADGTRGGRPVIVSATTLEGP